MVLATCVLGSSNASRTPDTGHPVGRQKQSNKPIRYASSIIIRAGRPGQAVAKDRRNVQSSGGDTPATDAYGQSATATPSDVVETTTTTCGAVCVLCCVRARAPAGTMQAESGSAHACIVAGTRARFQATRPAGGSSRVRGCRTVSQRGRRSTGVVSSP